MAFTRMERIACYALTVQLYFSPSVRSLLSSSCSSIKRASQSSCSSPSWTEMTVPTITILYSSQNANNDPGPGLGPGPPPLFNSSSLPSPEALPNDVPKDVSKESLDKAINSPEKTLYEILDASPTATRVELKKKYAQLARLSHPDAQIGKEQNTASGAGVEKIPDFGEISAAWRVLGDSKSRKRYDRELQYKEWAEYASKYANEKMEEAVPKVAKMMDDVALPFLRRTAATTVAVSQAVSNIGKSSASTRTAKDSNASKSFNGSNGDKGSVKDASNNAERRNPLSDAFANAIRAGKKAGRAIDTLELNEKSAQLTERAKNDQERAQTIQKELDVIAEKRLFASLKSEESPLSSEEARLVLDRISSNATADARPQNMQRIEKDIEALQETEKFFMDKLKAYEETDREWNALLSQQQYARDDLTKRKREEAEARRRLDDAIRMVSEAKASLVTTSSALRGVEQKVRKNASEMDRVTFTLSKKQERVRSALRKKAETSNGGGIQLEFLTEEELAALRRKEMQLAGESEQLARMVSRLSSRAEKLKSRAAALERYQKYEETASARKAFPSNPDGESAGSFSTNS